MLTFSLWVSSACVAVEEFGHEKEHGVLFVETLRVFTASDAMASMTTSYSCDQEPDLAEAYFGLLSTFIRCCPKVMSQCLPLLDLHLNTKYLYRISLKVFGIAFLSAMIFCVQCLNNRQLYAICVSFSSIESVVFV